MAEQALNPTIATSASGEGQDVLDMSDVRDLRMFNNQIVQFGIRNMQRVNRYLELLDKVMEDTEDERIVLGGASVAVNALKATVAALKRDAAHAVNNVQINMPSITYVVNDAKPAS